MIFTAYYDESGTHDGSPVTALAGLFGDVYECAHFEIEWRKVLKKHKLTYVRAKHMHHRQGQHKGWSPKQINTLWIDLLYVFQEYKNLSITKTVLKNEDYKRAYVGDGPLKKERLDSKYALCLRSCLHFHPVWHHDSFNGDGAVNFVLESGHRNAGDAIRVFNDLKNDKLLPWAKSIGSISFGSKADFPILQAADLIAYWFYQTECEKLRDDKLSEDNEYEISELEKELVHCGLTVLDHIILPVDLAKLRQNFLAKRKKRQVFGNTVINTDERNLRLLDDPNEPEIYTVRNATPAQAAYLRSQRRVT